MALKRLLYTKATLQRSSSSQYSTKLQQTHFFYSEILSSRDRKINKLKDIQNLMYKKREERINAYNLINELKERGLSNTQIIKEIALQTHMPYGTIHAWIKYDGSPFGRRSNRIKYNQELFYILGALFGDGCAYHWKKMYKHIVIVTGEKEFIEKYADKLESCLGKRIKGYPERSKNVWHLKTWNIELYQLFKKVRENRNFLSDIMNEGDHYYNSLQFIEGFFDAEGCVKIIKEKVRKTPKICLDITNTDYELLEIVRNLLQKNLNIEARYSIQKPQIGKDGSYRKTAYHLRIYKKEFVRKFFENIETIKLKGEKASLVHNWLNNGK